MSNTSTGARVWDAATIFALAAAVRLAVCWLLPTIHAPDELFQVLEQAHRLAFGYGVIPWEWRVGARSWLLPGVIGLFMRTVSHLTEDPRLLIFSVRAGLAVLASSMAVIAYCWGARYSRLHGLLCGFAVATWFECVYFAGRPLGEAVAASFIFAGFFAATSPSQHFANWLLSGLFLGLAGVLRFQLLPAIAITCVFLGRLELRARWLPMLSGGLIPVLALGLVDLATWGRLWGSILDNFRINIFEHRAEFYGTHPWWWYIAAVVGDWGGAVIGVVALAVVGARKAPSLLRFSGACLLIHALIGHKEYRFIYPALACLVFLAALGSAELLQGSRRPNMAFALGAIAWLGTSVALAVQPQWQTLWIRERALIQATWSVWRTGDLCGFGIAGMPWYDTGGYTYLHRKVPMFVVDGGSRDWSQLNVVLVEGGFVPPSQAGFVQRSCYQSQPIGNQPANMQAPEPVCVFQRRGQCSSSGPLEPINSWLAKRDQ
jgi:hypothetical protein